MKSTIKIMRQKFHQCKTIVFRKGDYFIAADQPANRFLVEMLEPTGDDSYFAWNYFDGILQRKEWYVDYRGEDLAAEVVKHDKKISQKLAAKKAADPKFAVDAEAILQYIFYHSPYYEAAHLNYPVYRLEPQ